MSTPIMPDAEAFSFEGTRGGVLLLHGYTATVQNVRGWAQAFAREGFSVEAPLLPGHGTSVEELSDTTWFDYLKEADVAYKKLAARHQHIVVGGLCLGAVLAGWLTLLYPETTSGLIVINGPFKSPGGGNPKIWRMMLDSGKKFFIWSTPPVMVQDPLAPALLSYDKVPIAPMESMLDAGFGLKERLGEIHCPVLVFTSLLDSSASPEDTKPWLEDVSGPAEHIVLERSNHVATLDYDKEILKARSISFAVAAVENEPGQVRQGAA